MRKVAIQDATKKDLWDFFDVENLEKPEGMTLEKVDRELLAKLVERAGLKHVYVEDAPDPAPAQPGADGILSKAGGERWVLCKFLPDPKAGGDKHPIYVSVNDLECYVPVGVKVCIRETLFDHLNVIEHRTPSTDATDGNEGARVSETEALETQRYPSVMMGHIGYVKDDLPQMVLDDEDILPVVPGNTMHMALVQQRQSRLGRMLAGRRKAA